MKNLVRLLVPSIAILGLAIVQCGGTDATTKGPTAGSTGSAGAGGGPGAGGAVQAGGASGAGGTVQAGGAPSSGGAAGAGGTVQAGGASGAGGTVAAGGSSGAGASGTGGTTVDAGKGGAAGVGGATGAGGATTPPGDGGTCGTYPHALSTGWAAKPAACAPFCMRFRNYCPYPLWMHTGLAPDDQKLDPGASIDVPTPATWASKRANASKVGPNGDVTEFVEMHFANGIMNYNVTYVDWFALPVEVTGVGGSCNQATSTTGCYMKEAEVMTGCPEPQLKQGVKCRSPGNFCGGGNTDPLCKLLDPAIQACTANGVGCPPLGNNQNTFSAFACAGFYAGSPKLCAALNRGMAGSVADAADSNRNHFYQKPPYSTYSKWLQCKCPVVYTFPYDDMYEQGGFRSCKGDELRVTWCPGDMP